MVLLGFQSLLLVGKHLVGDETLVGKLDETALVVLKRLDCAAMALNVPLNHRGPLLSVVPHLGPVTSDGTSREQSLHSVKGVLVDQAGVPPHDAPSLIDDDPDGKEREREASSDSFQRKVLGELAAIRSSLERIETALAAIEKV